MNNTKLIAVITAALLANSTTAQMVNYKADNQTKKLSPVKVAATLSFASGNQISAGGILQGNLVDKLFYHAEYRKGLVRGFSNAGVAGKDELTTTQKETKGGYMEIGAEWAIVDDMGSGTFKIVTDQSMSMERYFRAAVDMRKLVTVGGGIFSLSHAYYLGDDTAHYFMSGATKLQPPKDKILHSAVNTTGFFAGISLRKIKKAAVSSGGYRYRNFKATSWSFQLMSGASKMQDLEIATKTYPITNAKSAPIGYRIMWRSDRGRTSTCAELGKMPHIKFDNGNAPDMSMFGTEGISTVVNYFRLGFNVILYGNDRRYALKQKKA